MAQARRIVFLALVLLASLAASPCCTAADPDLKIVEFAADWCKPCQSMQPAIAKLAREGWQVSHVNVERDAELVKTFQVKSVPTIVILRHGQEVDRIIGALGYEKLLTRFNAAASAPATVRGQSPAPIAAFPLLGSGAFGSLASAPSATPSASAAHQGAVREMAEAPMASIQPPQLQPIVSRTPSADAIARAAAATVRIRIDEPNAVSFGTGTIINVHGDQALVLTCGHLFRDIKSDAKLAVDLFSNGSPMTIPAQLVSYKAKECDIGLIEFRTPHPIKPVLVAPLNEAPQVGDVAFSYGCDKGADPSRRDTQIKRINRYLGAANVEIHGAPVVGRSGGGLFDAQGRLIGVCNAADEEDNEGIYAALPVVHEHIAGLQLQELNQSQQLVSSQAQPAQAHPAQAHPAQSHAVQPASWQPPAGQQAFGQNSLASATQAQASSMQPNTMQPITPSAGGYWPDQIAGAPTAAVAQAAATSAAASQLHCVVRDAAGKESHITIDRPSEELIAALRQHAQR